MADLGWGPRPGAFAFGGVLLAAGIGWMVVAADVGDRVIAGAVMLIVLAAMLAGWRMRDRLHASTTGLVVGTISGKRAIAWSRVRRIAVVPHKRMGSTTHSLEIDLDDDDLLVFGRMDLGVDPELVAAELVNLRTGRSG